MNLDFNSAMVLVGLRVFRPPGVSYVSLPFQVL